MRILLNWVLIVLLFIAFLFLNYKIWLSDTGYIHYQEMSRVFTEKSEAINNMKDVIKERKEIIKDLKGDTGVLDYAARSELGLIAPGETYYQIND